jgi:hypothetical protein
MPRASTCEPHSARVEESHDRARATRLRELEVRDSELSDLLDAAGRDLAPPDVLARSAHRLSAAIGFSLADAAGLSAPPIDPATAASATTSASAKGVAAASTVKGAATIATAKSGAAFVPMLAAAAKPMLVVALASAISVAVWAAQPRRAPAPRASEAPHVAAPAVIAPQAARTKAVDAIELRAPAPAIVAPTAAAAPAPAARPVVKRRAMQGALTPASTTAIDSWPEAAEELRSLQAAQAMLASQPANAALRLRAHAKRWPNGWLDEERAALLVEALSSDGQHDEAQRALSEFRARNPRSPALPRLSRILARASAVVR